SALCVRRPRSIHFPYTTLFRSPGAGDTWRFPDQARSLRLIAETGGEAFYRGELADALVAAALSEGGPLRHEDLAGHSADWVGTVDRKSTRLNSSHVKISYAVFC